MLGPSLTMDQKIAGAAALVATAALIVSWLSWRVAARALRVAELDQREKHADLSAYLVDGVRWSVSDGSHFVGFYCSVSNNATAPLAVVSADLHLHLLDEEGRASAVVLAQTLVADLPFPDSTPLGVPINLSARCSVSGWLKYKLPDRVSNTKAVDRYELVFSSSTGDRSTLSAHLLRFLDHANSTV